MSLQMFMKMDGIEGESKSYKHKGWSEILSWNWGMTSNRKAAHASDDDRISLNEISLTKAISMDSTVLRLLFAQGKTIPNVELVIWPILSKKETQTKYVSLNLEDVLIKSIVTGGTTEEEFFKEHVVLLFDRVSFEYSRTLPPGSAGVEPEEVDYKFKWNVPSAAEWEQ